MLELQLALVANITGMYLLGILFWYSRRTFSRRNKGNEYLYVLFTASFIELMTHLFTTVIQYYNFFGIQTLGTIMYSFVFTINAIYILAWVLYLNERLGRDAVHDKAYYRRVMVLSGPVLLLLVLSIVNMFVPIYFSYYNMDYVRLPGYYITLLVPVGYMIYGIMLFLRSKQRKKLYQELPFVSLILPVVIAHILESLFINLCVIPLSNTITLVILVLMNAKQNSVVDPISGVYTKNEMYRYLGEKSVREIQGEKVSGIMIRLEYLSDINAKYGYKMGTQAISDLGFLLRSNLPDGAIAYHIADDRFIVILEGMKEDEVRGVVGKLKAMILHFNQETATTYELHISYGIGFLKENDTFDRFIDRMEKRLNSNHDGKKVDAVNP